MLPLKVLIYSALLQEPFTGTVQHHLNDTLLLGTSVERQCTSANGTSLKMCFLNVSVPIALLLFVFLIHLFDGHFMS